jgi:hypothetical protein
LNTCLLSHSHSRPLSLILALSLSLSPFSLHFSHRCTSLFSTLRLSFLSYYPTNDFTCSTTIEQTLTVPTDVCIPYFNLKFTVSGTYFILLYFASFHFALLRTAEVSAVWWWYTTAPNPTTATAPLLFSSLHNRCTLMQSDRVLPLSLQGRP